MKYTLRKNSDSPKRTVEGNVSLPKKHAALGIAAFILFLIITLIVAFSDEPLWVTGSFAFFSLLGIILLIMYINCRISYNDDGFISKNFFGISREFTYEQVTSIKKNTHDTYLYLGEKKIVIENDSIGLNRFIKHVKKKYKTIHNGNRLPDAPNSKYDLFNGNVREPIGFLFGYGLIGVIFLTFLAYTIYLAFFAQSTESNTIKQTISFVSCEASNDEVILMCADEQVYKIQFSSEKLNFTGIEALCNGKSNVSVYSTLITTDEGEEFYSVKALSHNGSFLLSFDQTNDLHRAETLLLVIIVACLVLLWAAFVIISVIIGRNPKEFSKRVVRLFFEEGSIKY